MYLEWNILNDIDIFHKKFYIISKYCPISNSKVKHLLFIDMNNIELSSDSDSSNEVYIILIILIIVTIEIINC